jgi:carbohydrate-selective porin OprB
MTRAGKYYAVLLVILVLGLGAGVRADSSGSADSSAAVEATSDKQPSGFWLVSEPRQMAHWLEGKGITPNLTLVNDWSKNFRGGSSTAGTFDRYSLDVSLTLDDKKAFGWNGGTEFIRLKNHLGDSGGDYVGDAQGFSNIDDVPRTHLYELWFQQTLLGDKLRFKAGKIDANTEFATVQTAGDFLNSSMGYSPTVLALPTYPEPQPGLNVFIHPKQPYQIGFGVFRTAQDGDMLIFEGGRNWSLGEHELGGRASFGMWHLTGPVPCFDGSDLPGTQGFYMVTEQSLWSRKRAEPAGEEKLSAFLQYGRANGEVSRFTQHLGGGFVLDSPFAARPHDAIGLAATSASFTEDPSAGFQENAETAVELYYKISIKSHISLIPDLQFIHHPGGLRSQGDALVLTPRLSMSF